MDGTPGLSLAELVSRAPPTGAAYQPEDVMKAVIRSEVRAGRVLERDGGFALDLGRWDRAQVDALRSLNDPAESP